MVNRDTQRGLIMNRVFKFRAWEESESRMYKCIVGNTDGNDNDFICPMIWIEERYDWVHSDTCKITQYTGYKDIQMSDEEMTKFYSKPTENIYDLHIN